MNIEYTQQVWQRAKEGKHSLVKGVARISPPPEDLNIFWIRIDCTHYQEFLGTLFETQKQISFALNSHIPLLGIAAKKLKKSLYKRFVSDVSEEEERDFGFNDSLNRLKAYVNCNIAIVFELSDFADESSMNILIESLHYAEDLNISMIFLFREQDPSKEYVRRFIKTFVEYVGVDGVLEQKNELLAKIEKPIEFSIKNLDNKTRQLLYLCSVVGSNINSDLISKLLKKNTKYVIEKLQLAKDNGLPIEDLGDGKFIIPEKIIDSVKSEMLPSLKQYWHTELALFIETNTEKRYFLPEEIQEIKKLEDNRRKDKNESFIAIKDDTSNESSEDSVHNDNKINHEFFSENKTTENSYEEDKECNRSNEEKIYSNELSDDNFFLNNTTKTALHLSAAGKFEEAAQRYLFASEEATLLGAYDQALIYAQEGLSLINQLPTNTQNRILRVKLMVQMGRMFWESSGPSLEHTLNGALHIIEEAESLLKKDDDAKLQALTKTIKANICYDYGDKTSLDKALDALTYASRLLENNGYPLDALRLLSDQAAVWIRIGDHVRAYHLLEESRKFLEQKEPKTPDLQLEYADTLHLLARLTFHVPPRPGKEKEAIEVGMKNAQLAERIYTNLQMKRPLARVWETLGRLETLANSIDSAENLLKKAMDIQRFLGDLIGLARTTSAFAELLAIQKQYPESITVLGDSISLNLEKGSIMGLLYNRQSLEKILNSIPSNVKISANSLILTIQERLKNAEELLNPAKIMHHNKI